jgi:hypothetical protein
MVLRDSYGRDLRRRGVTLVDWEGHIANPAARLTIELSPRVNLPARVRLSANGPRLMFDLFSEVGPHGPSKTLIITGPERTARFLMATFPDRDGADEAHELTIELTTGMSERRADAWPVRVLDQDRERPPGHRIHLDYAHDELRFFDDPALRSLCERAAQDWAYFLDDQGFDTVEAHAETGFVNSASGFDTGKAVTNSSAFSGFLLFAQSIKGPERRSGGRCSGEGGLQTRSGKPTGLRRSGTVIAEVTGNWNGLGWSVEPSDDRWWVSSNHARERHDFYSIIRHEIGHAILYHKPIPGFGRLVRSGALRDRGLARYLGRAPRVNPVEHLYDTVDPVSRVGVFGNEYGGDMPRKRWLITRTDLLIARAAGYRLRDTTPLQALSVASDLTIRGRVGEALSGRIEASGGIPEYRFAVVGSPLPEGVRLDDFTGELAGVPTRAGRFRCVVEVRDADPTGSAGASPSQGTSPSPGASPSRALRCRVTISVTSP